MENTVKEDIIRRVPKSPNKAFIHSGLFNYDEVINMTVYQIKNSFEVITKKDSFEINMMHRVSPKFDIGKEKFEHWTEKVKIGKSNLSKNY